jgi:hypothetical protein
MIRLPLTVEEAQEIHPADRWVGVAVVVRIVDGHAKTLPGLQIRRRSSMIARMSSGGMCSRVCVEMT